MSKEKKLTISCKNCIHKKSRLNFNNSPCEKCTDYQYFVFDWSERKIKELTNKIRTLKAKIMFLDIINKANSIDTIKEENSCSVCGTKTHEVLQCNSCNDIFCRNCCKLNYNDLLVCSECTEYEPWS